MPMHKEQVETLSEESLLDGFFKVSKFLLRHSTLDAQWSPPIERLVLQRPDAVCAIVYHEQRDALLVVRQFRAGVAQKDHGWMTELAAGLVDPGESPETAIVREIREELGYQVKNPRLIKTIYTSPAILSERIFIYFVTVSDASKVSSGGGVPEENEDIELLEVRSNEIERFLAENTTIDAKTLIGMEWFVKTRQSNAIT